METTIQQVTAHYRAASSALKQAKKQSFRHGRFVRVNSARFKGIGIVDEHGDDRVPLDQLSVRICNGNVWWYPIEDCAPLEDRSQVGRELRLVRLRMAGIRCSASPRTS